VVSEYPVWSYFPRNTRPPSWALDLAEATAAAQDEISTAPDDRRGIKSDDVLRALAPSLAKLGYAVEASKRSSDKIKRPVLFGDNGRPSLSYEIDAFHDEHGIVVEVEAGRGAQSNAVHRDIIRTSLILDARFLALLVPQKYRFASGARVETKLAYAATKDQLDAIYASDRLQLPFEGVAVIGY
jgi:hypothetical protein